MNDLPTIFVSLPYGMCARNFLRSKAHAFLKGKSRQILWTPLSRDASFQSEFKSPDVEIPPYVRPSPATRLALRWLSDAVTLSRLRKRPIETFTVIRDTIKSGFADPILMDHAGIFSWRTRFLLAVPGGVRLLSWLADVLSRISMRRALIQAKPDLVYLTHPHDSQDRALASVCNQLGIPVIGIIHSWDNITSKRLLTSRLDRLIVWNNLLKNEAMDIYGFSESRIFVSGIPQMDFVADPGAFDERVTFLRDAGLDPSRKLIVFACGAPEFCPDQVDVLDDLINAMENGRFSSPAQLVIRTHPGREIPGLNRLMGRPHVTVDVPTAAYGALAHSKGWDGSGKDARFFQNLIHHCDVFVNCFSTTTIDAAVSDRPVISLSFDGHRQLPYYASCRKHFDFTHYRPIVASGGSRIVGSQAELEEAVDAYLKDPSLDSAGRERIRNEQCQWLDGKAGERIGRFLWESIQAARSGEFFR